MSRIFDYTPDDDETVVSRILVTLHKAIDDNFPKAMQTDRHFTKTVFSETNIENTAIVEKGPTDANFQEREVSSPYLGATDVEDVGDAPPSHVSTFEVESTKKMVGKSADGLAWILLMTLICGICVLLFLLFGTI